MNAFSEAWSLIDPDGYRPGVGMIVCNPRDQVLWARRVGGKRGWQFPQGGIDHDESPEDALYRELYEEVGLRPECVEVLAVSSGWMRYDIPSRFRRRDSHPPCIGQKQRWYLLRLLAGDDAIRVDAQTVPEFDRWRWAGYWEPVDEVIHFKRPMYRRVLKEFAAVIGAAARPGRAGSEVGSGEMQT